MFDDWPVRTTLDLDDDVLQAAKEMAESRQTTAGKIVSELMRKALQSPPSKVRVRNGVPLLPRRQGAPVMTMKLVNDLRDAE